jgi:hypothetical protein
MSSASTESAAAPLDTHNVRLTFGRFRGELLTRVPASYLKWMAGSGSEMADLARAEMERRGTATPDIDVTGHALDRASTRLWRLWKKTRRNEEGLHAWLSRRAAEAIRKGTRDGDRVTHAGVVFFVKFDGSWPVLASVCRKRGDDGE